MKHSFRIALTSAALFVCAYAVLWYMGLFDNLGFHGSIAAVLGVLLTSGLAIGLMTVMFHSNRTRKDEEVHDPPWQKRHGQD